MTVLIIGYPDSGKSALAEKMVLEISEPGSRIYLATMIPFGDEGKARIEKHRRMREGKGFETVEAAFDVSSALADRDIGHTTVLLECLSNLTANELFERHTDFNTAIERICDDVTELACRAENLVIVSNHFDISDAFDRAVSDRTVKDPASAAVLLECLSNLVANEMFERHTDAEALTEKIADDILMLSEKAGDLVIVSNRFEVTEDFDEETRAYAEVMDMVNERISGIADEVIRI